MEDTFEVAPIDAVAATDGVFTATHHPLAIVRQSLKGGAGPGTVVDEGVLLEHFSGPNNAETTGANDGLMIFPIIGDSGTGKSHLVRWLRASVGERPDWHVVYVPKWGTNLRRVVELVLGGVEGEVFDDARSKLAQAADASIDLDVAPEKLLNELQVLVGRTANEEGHNSDYRGYLIESLPDFLSDPLVRKTLLAKDGVIQRFVDLVTAGRSVGDGLDEEAFRFSTDDIPVDIARIADASLAARDVYTNLAGDTQLQETAVALLNAELESAVRSLFLTSEIRVADVLRQVRRALLDEGKELVLFIEDMTVLHGVQRELLDALTEPARRSGTAELCDLRVAMAVTSGYFDDLDTVAARAQEAYSLDLEYGSTAGITPSQVVEFVGRYLNAARVGRASIDAAFSVGTTDWMPNACTGCDHRTECHEGFGTVSIGDQEYGLFPFNEPALDRMVKSVSRPFFDARTILREVFHHILSSGYQELPDGQFPSAQAVNRFDDREQAALDPRVSEELQRRDTRDYERRSRVLTYWGGVPESVVDLTAGIHASFDLPPIGAPTLVPPAPVGTDGDGPGSTIPPSSAVGDKLPAKVRKCLEQINDWQAKGDKLPQTLANDLRKTIHSSIVSRIEAVGEHRLSTDQFRSKGKFFRPDDVRLERGESGNHPGGYSLEIPASPTLALILRALVLAGETGTWAAQETQLVLAEFVEATTRWASEVEHAWRTRPTNDALLSTGVQALLYTAKIADVEGSTSRSHYQLLAASLSPTTNPGDGRSKEWDRLLDTASSKDREKLRNQVLEVIGAAKGTGSTRAIDAGRVLPAIANFVRNDSHEVPDDADSDAANYFKKVLKGVDSAVASEWEVLNKWNTDLEPHLDPSTPIEQVHAAVDNAVDKATHFSVLTPPDAKIELRALRAKVPSTCLESWRTVREVLERGTDRPSDQVLSDVAPDRRGTIVPLVDYVSFAAQTVKQSQAEATRQRGLMGSVAAVSLSDIANAAETVLTELDNWSDGQ